ncbi:uncharacterized protein LOC113383077 [Ctenocephalides felis]|uniref:uncharacterized protein LOC113383077 n=1 Tax=Ctenocephalides felis TaxID=7515 RepID=UPI000E6E1955|nr:uncharacterized protein LOC113383077 [Ctenocephalides felis]
MAKHQKAFILLLVASTISLATAVHHKEEHHPIFIDNPEPSKEASLDLPIVLIPSDDIKKKDDNILVKSEEVNIDKKLKPAELVFNKKYFDDNPLIPPSHEALVPKVVCEEGSKDCEKHKKKDKRSGRHRRHHKHRRSRRASGDKKDDKKVEDTDIDKPQSDAPYDLVTAESYASNPCLLPYTPRCGGPSYDIVNPFERRYNGNFYQLPRQSPSNYYLPVVPPVSIGRWVPDTSIRYFPINRVYWNPGYPYDNRPYLPPFRPTKRPNTIDRPGATEKPDIEIASLDK